MRFDKKLEGVVRKPVVVAVTAKIIFIEPDQDGGIAIRERNS